MTTARLIAKSMVEGFEDLREVLPRIIEAIKFLTLLTLPKLLPFGLMYFTLAGY